MQFPEFDLLHMFIDGPPPKYNISFSDMIPSTLSEVGIRFEEADLGKTSIHGSLELRKLLGDHAGVPPENVIVTSSCSEANLDVCASMLKPGDEAIVVMPNYPPLRDLPIGVGAKTKLFFLRPEDDFQLDLVALRAALTKETKLVIMTNLNNPTSSMVTADQLEGIAALAEEFDFHVLCDETFKELAFEKQPPSAGIFGDRMIVTNTMSKVYGMGALKVGWIFASGTARSRILNFTEYNTVSPPYLSELIVVDVMKNKKKFIERARGILKRNRPIVQDWLERNDRIHWNDPGIGNIAFPKVDADVDLLTSVLLKKYSTVIAAGRYFGVPDRFRLGFGRDAEGLAEGLENFDKALKELG